MSEAAPAFFLGLPVPIAAALITLVGTVLTVLGAWLVWFLTRRKGETEKTWEKRRELYTQLLLKLQALEALMKPRQETYLYYKHAEDYAEQQLTKQEADQENEGISFVKSVAEIKGFMDENILYISDGMEEIVGKVIEASYNCHGMPSRGMPTLWRHKALYKAATETFRKSKHQAQREIRIRSITFRIKSAFLKACRWVGRMVVHYAREARSRLHVANYHSMIWLKGRLF